MANRYRKGINAAALVLAISAFLASCAGRPQPIPEDTLASLGAGAFIYVKAELPVSRPLIDGILPLMSGDKTIPNSPYQFITADQHQINEALDRCDQIRGALWLDGVDQRWRLAADGRFPSFWASIAFFFDPSWRKGGVNPRQYWRFKNGPALAFIDDSSVLISDSEPFALSAGPALIGSMSDEYTSADLWLWLPDAEEFAGKLLGPVSQLIRLPIKEFSALFNEASNLWRPVVIARFASEREAKAFAALFRIVSRNIDVSGLDDNPGLLVLLKNASLSIQSERIIFELEPMEEERVASLIQGFMPSFLKKADNGN